MEKWVQGDVKQVWISGDTWVEFQAFLIEPPGLAFCKQHLPLAVCFPGLGARNPAVADAVRRVALEPFVLVVAIRPKKGWWFIDDGSKHGWITGNVRHNLVRCYVEWIGSLAVRSGIDRDRVGIFGHSAGAYAVLEVLMASNIRFSGVGVSGVHGHGQWDCTDIPRELHDQATLKFADFVRRLAQHGGANFIHATHSPNDRCSKWEDASLIIRALDVGQNRRRMSKVIVRPLCAPEDLDTVPTSRRNRLWHDYFNAAFCRSEFFRRLLGGEFVYQPASRAMLAATAAPELPQSKRCRLSQQPVEAREESQRAWRISTRDARHPLPDLRVQTSVELPATREEFERGPHGSGRPQTTKEHHEFTNRRQGFKASLEALGDGYWKYWNHLVHVPRPPKR